MKSILAKYLIIASFLVAPNLVAAQNSGQQDITSDLKVFKLKTANGQATRQAAKTVEPGDTLEYQLTYTNHLNEAISQLKPVLPIPSGIKYLGKSAQPAITAASLSLQQGPLQSLPIQEEVTTSSGLTATKEASPEEFRRIQWLVDSLQGNASVTLTAKVVVINTDALTSNAN